MEVEDEDPLMEKRNWTIQFCPIRSDAFRIHFNDNDLSSSFCKTYLEFKPC